jgi:hypothetical protein
MLSKLRILVVTGAILSLITGSAVAQKFRSVSLDDPKANDALNLINSASKLIAQRGHREFSKLEKKTSPWSEAGLFVLDENGKCVSHSDPYVRNRDLSKDLDIKKKAYVQEAWEFASYHPNNSWVHYQKWDGTKFYPDFHSLCVKKVVAFDNKTYLLYIDAGSLKPSRYFIQEQVGNIQRRLEIDENALSALKASPSQLTFLNTYIYILDSDGKMIVHPEYSAFNGIDFKRVEDETGLVIFDEIQNKLNKSANAWLTLKWKLPDEREGKRRSLYVSKVEIGERTLFLCCPLPDSVLASKSL